MPRGNGLADLARVIVAILALGGAFAVVAGPGDVAAAFAVLSKAVYDSIPASDEPTKVG